MNQEIAEALPDQAMQNMLAEEGQQIARRTITKYEKRSESAHLVTANERMPINRWIETSRERLSCPVPLKLPREWVVEDHVRTVVSGYRVVTNKLH